MLKLILIFFSITTYASENIKDLNLYVTRYDSGNTGNHHFKTYLNGEVETIVNNLEGEVSQSSTILMYDLKLDNDLNFEVHILLPPYFKHREIDHKVYTVTYILKSTSNRDSYKMFNFAKNSLQLQFPAPGMRFSSPLMTRINRGDNHDTSKIFMGNPSKLIKKGMFKKDELWLHHSTWGQKEAFRIVNSPEMIKYFDKINSVLTYMNTNLQKAYQISPKKVVELANDERIIKLIKEVANWTLEVDFVNSTTHKAVMSIQEEFHGDE